MIPPKPNGGGHTLSTKVLAYYPCQASQASAREKRERGKKREIRANKLMRMGIVLYVQSLKVTCAGSVLCSRETEPKACCPPLFLRRLIEARKKFANFDEQTDANRNLSA